MFNCLGPAGGHLSIGEGLQGVQVRHDRPGLVECAHQVLPHAQVHGCLPPDGCVHHCRQGSGNLNEGHSPEEGGCHKAGQVSHHAAAKGDDGVAALTAMVRQPRIDGLRGGYALAGFPGGNDVTVGLHAGVVKGAFDPLAVGRGHVGVGDDEHRAGEAQVPQALSDVVEDAPIHKDRVGCRLGGDDKGGVELPGRRSLLRSRVVLIEAVKGFFSHLLRCKGVCVDGALRQVVVALSLGLDLCDPLQWLRAGQQWPDGFGVSVAGGQLQPAVDCLGRCIQTHYHA